MGRVTSAKAKRVNELYAKADWHAARPDPKRFSKRKRCGCRSSSPDHCVAIQQHMPVELLASSDHCLCRCHNAQDED